MNYLKIISGIIFIVFGIIILINNKTKKPKYELKNPFLSGFIIISILEMGDKTQIASALFATIYNPLMVFLGVISALILLSVLAIFLGKFIVKKINQKTISYIAGILFIIMGIFCFF